MSWREQAACQGMDTNIFFPEEHATLEPALQICRGCPVQQQCLQEALSDSNIHGVWGGKSHDARKRIRRRLGLTEHRTLQPIRHGTPGGRNAHKRRGEPPCRACLDAYNRFHRDYARMVKKRQGAA